MGITTKTHFSNLVKPSKLSKNVVLASSQLPCFCHSSADVLKLLPFFSRSLATFFQSYQSRDALIEKTKPLPSSSLLPNSCPPSPILDEEDFLQFSKILHFLLVPTWCWYCWVKEYTLRSKDLKKKHEFCIILTFFSYFQISWVNLS